MTSDRRPLWHPTPDLDPLDDQPTPDARLTAVERAVPLPLHRPAAPAQQPSRSGRRPLGPGGLAATND